MSDADLLSRVVERAYEALAFEPGSGPDWAEFNAVFHPDAVLALRVFPQDASVSVLGLREYADAQMQHGLGEEGYSETPGERTMDVVGDVAVVRQQFTMNFAGRPPVQAVDVFSLARMGRDWLIVAVVSDLDAARGR